MAAAKFKPVDEQFSYLKKGSAEIIREDELKSKLERSIATGKPLRVYLGVDPTAMLARKEAWAEAYRRTPHGKPVELASSSS